MKKWVKIAVLCVMAGALTISIKADNIYAQEYYDYGYDYEDGINEEDAEPEIYEQYSYVLSSETLRKGTNKYYSIENETYYSYTLGKYVSPTNIKWSVDGKAIKIKSKDNKKKVKIGAVAEGEATLSVTYDINYSSYIYRYTSSAAITVFDKPEVYEYNSYVLSSESLLKGTNKYYAIEDGEYYSWYYNAYVKPKKVKWSVEGDAIKLKSKKNSKKVKIGAVKEGEATLSVTYEIDYGTYINRYTSSATIYVSNPKVAKKTIGVNLHSSSSSSLEITGCNSYSDVACKTSSKNVYAYVRHSWWENKTYLQVEASKKGNYVVKVTIDGKEFRIKVKAFSAYFKSKTAHSVDTWMDGIWHEGYTMLALYKGQKETLKVRGLKAGTKIKWKSTDKKVATVNKDGVVTAHKPGYCTIIASFDGASITYEVGVAEEKAIKAVHYAIKHHGSEYSQAKRMENGKYDCSSYVFRAYRDSGFVIGDDKSYAPTAANMAKWCEKKGYVIADGEVDVADLLPGDLVFETGEDNGRYKGIYHVDMYVGNHSMLTVERTKWREDKIYNCVVARVRSVKK